MRQTTLIRSSLPDGIRAALREQILSGELAMGERLTEQGIAEAMGTSAGPVREAFASLTFEGLLISLPHRGTFVSSVSEEEARGAYVVRRRLEPTAFELTAARLTPEIVGQLQGILDELAEAAKQEDYAAMISADMRFHGMFYAESGNTLLAAVWPLIEGTIRKFVAVAGPQYGPDYAELASRHQLLLDNVVAGDMKAVTRELGQHGEDIWRNLPAPKKGAPRPRAKKRSS